MSKFLTFGEISSIYKTENALAYTMQRECKKPGSVSRHRKSVDRVTSKHTNTINDLSSLHNEITSKSGMKSIDSNTEQVSMTNSHPYSYSKSSLNTITSRDSSMYSYEAISGTNKLAPDTQSTHIQEEDVTKKSTRDLQNVIATISTI